MNDKLVRAMLEDISDEDEKPNKRFAKHGSAMAIKNKDSLIENLKLPKIGKNIKVGS